MVVAILSRRVLDWFGRFAVRRFVDTVDFFVIVASIIENLQAGEHRSIRPSAHRQSTASNGLYHPWSVVTTPRSLSWAASSGNVLSNRPLNSQVANPTPRKQNAVRLVTDE
jgi:hypothetical protein